MTQEFIGDQDDPSVRVELFGGEHDTTPDITTPGGAGGGPSRVPAVAMVLAVLGLLGGLFWLSDSGTGPASEDAEPDSGEQLERGESDDRPQITDRPNVELLDPQTFTPLSSFPRYVAELDGEVFAVAAGGPEDENGVQLQRTVDGSRWEYAPVSTAPDGSRAVGLHKHDGQVVVFTASRQSETVAADELIVHVFQGDDAPTSERWQIAARIPIDGFVRTVSARDGRWAAMVDRRAQISSNAPPMQTQILTGPVGANVDGVNLLEVAPDEFVASYAATADGFYALVVRDPINNPGTGPDLQLRLWTAVDGWEVLDRDIANVSNGEWAEVIDGGERGVFVSIARQLYLAVDDVPAERWPRMADGIAVTGGLADSLFPKVSPARTGDGFSIVDTAIGYVGHVWVSTNGLLWQRFVVDGSVRDVSMLRITPEGDAIFVGVSEEQPVAFSFSLVRPNVDSSSSPASLAANTPAFQPEVLERTIVDGEWSTPVFSTANNDGQGFVGLSNVNGQISLIESENGVDATSTRSTDFPFGYFTNDLQTTSAGFHAIGQLGLFEDAVFTSGDGVSWERFPIERPGTATALQIDHFHRSENTAVLVGSLGWADDLARTELVAMWWGPDGEVQLIPARPCLDEAVACSVSSLVAVDDGVVATYRLDGTTQVSTWGEIRGWQRASVRDLGPEAYLQSLRPNEVSVLGSSQIAISPDGGQTWTVAIEGPPGVNGRFVGWSASGDTALFATASDAWLLSSGVWTRFTLEFIELGRVLAVTDRAVLATGSIPGQPIVVRFASPGGS